MGTPQSPRLDLYTVYARSFINNLNRNIRAIIPQHAAEQVATVLSTPSFIKPVGILGAGASGLYTAMILEDLGIPYQILEARNRVGGRLFTYQFPNDHGAPFNYFDIGAMRFPKIPIMNRLFDLFENPHLNTPDIALHNRLRPFYHTGLGNSSAFYSYNGITVRRNAVPLDDPFKSAEILGNVEGKDAYLAAGHSAIVDDVIKPYATALLDDIKHGTDIGWKKLQSLDDYSTRAYISFKYEPSPHLNLPPGPLPTDVVNWCEKFGSSGGLYDLAFSDFVLHQVARGWQPVEIRKPVDWFCVDGGSQRIADAMAAYLNKQNPNAIVFDAIVTAITLTGAGTIRATVEGQASYEFSHIISTIPIPVMRTLDLNSAGLSSMQFNAIRQLNYGPAIKIGMQFKSAWWTTGKDRNGNPLNIIGGQTDTDGLLSTVVYPSFGEAMNGGTFILIAGYSRGLSAIHIGALIDKDNDRLVQLVLKDLADIHSIDVGFLSSELIDTKAWSWSQDPYAMGGWAFFGPGKFRNVHTSLRSPAGDGRLHFAGEALSIRHSWVEGALESAWRAVSEMLLDEVEFTAVQRQRFVKNWGERPGLIIPADQLKNGH